MKLSKGLASVAVSTAAISAVSAPIASATDSSALHVAPSVNSGALQGVELSNLRWTPVHTISGITYMLRVSSDPEVEPGGVFFLYNPDTEASGGFFLIGGDVPARTVRSWQSAVFPANLSVRKTEVRYGSPQSPNDARIVASVTNGWISG